jgi:glycosyltransferase involved in cell wall biosynthesis
MSEKQTVIIFSTAYLPMIGGAELAVKNITDRIQDIDFKVITARMNRSYKRREMIGNTEIYRVGIGIPVVDKVISPFVGAYYAYILTKQQNIIAFWSIMVSFTSGAPFLLKLLRLNRSIPIVLTLQEGDSEEHINKHWFGLLQLSWKLALGLADQVQVISTYLGDFARRKGYKGSITLIPNGVDVKKFAISHSQFSAEKVIITTSRLVEKNGIDILIRAFTLVKKEIPEARLHIVGDGSLRIQLEQLVKDENMVTSVTFFGIVPNEQIPEYLAQASLFVRPSRSEGLGISFLEAMAAGLPVVATQVGGIADFLIDEQTGLVARVDDPKDVAEKIIRLLNNDSLRTQLQQNGRTLVEKKYTWDGIASRMRDLILSTI